MILVAAVAIGIAWCRLYDDALNAVAKVQTGTNRLYRWRIAYVWPILAALTLAVPLVRRTQPRDRSRRLSRRPGTAACRAATVGIAFSVITSAYQMTQSGAVNHRVPLYLGIMVHRLPQFCAVGVAAVWVTMWLSGQWRRESEWIGRLGKCLGIGWIIGWLLLEFHVWI